MSDDGDRQWRHVTDERARAERERRQRMIVVGLASIGGVVLVIGVISFLLFGSGPGDQGDETASTTVTAATTVPSTSTTVAATTTTTTSTTTSTTTTTTIPLPSTVDAGPDLLAGAGQVVTLAAVDVGEATPDDWIRWVQTAGPDVTAGVGALGGPTVSFSAPGLVGHVSFRLVVADPATADPGIGGADAADPPDESTSVGDDVVVRIVEDASSAIFVDGELGDDAGSGTIEQPLRTLAAAAASGRDIYVRSVGTYELGDETLVLGDGVDLYGGYGPEWLRDPLDRTLIRGAATAISVSGVDGDEDRTIATVDVTAADAPRGADSTAVLIEGVTVRIEDSRVVAGAGGAGTADAPAGGLSVGVDARAADRLEIARSTVNAAAGGAGWSGPDEAGPAPDVAPSGRSGAVPVGASGSGEGRVRGGDAGDGSLLGDGTDSPGGASGGRIGDPDGEAGPGGAGGDGGVGGGGGAAPGSGADVAALFAGSPGENGAGGQTGVGGVGGGGGAGLGAALGGGGGAGGVGGTAGPGGAGGGGGGGSVGLRALDVKEVAVVESLIAAGSGGAGGVGAVGGRGGDAGVGGDGAPGDEVLFQTAGSGGSGGGGGGGGAGGQGGGGAGGPSFGLVTGQVGAVTIVSSEIRAGGGGAGGPGGAVGVGGSPGSTGSGRSGGAGGAGGDGVDADRRSGGADGGASIAWFDASDAQQDLADSFLVTGVAGSGGAGSPGGDAGLVAERVG